MKVNSLYCKNFRNLKELFIYPDSNMNVICGENAQGKTNIIEAIWLFCGAKSFKGTKENNFINFECEKAQTKLNFDAFGVENTASMEFGEKRTAFLNEKALNAPAALAGNFTAVIFSPDDLSLIKEGPQKRRKFIDTAIAQIYPQYIEILKDYMRAVAQRNKIIKDYKYDSSLSIMLDVFEQEIATKGAKIISYRKSYIDLLNQYVPEIYGELSSGREKMKGLYVANCEYIIKEKLEQARKNDMFTGVTSIGPHRDDIEFLINGISARNFGSQGQQRSIALTLKLSGAEVQNKKSGEYPVILLDDVMSELDPTRQNFVFNHIRDKQSFITCCDENSLSRLKEGKIFNISKGNVV